MIVLLFENTMKYFKLLIANLFVASVLALALTGTSKADGIDDPTFYAPKKARHYGQLFDWCMSSKFNNSASRCRIYDDMGPFNWQDDSVDIPVTQVHVKQISSVPEPEQTLLLGVAVFMLGVYKKCK